MSHSAIVVIGIIVMIGLIVGLDIAFLRGHFALRLTVNIAIVAVFGISYLLLRRHF